MEVQFGSSPSKRPAYETPPQVLLNWFAEEAPSQPARQFNLLPAPGLASYVTLGASGIVTGLFRQDGVQSGNLFAVSDKTLYEIDSAGSATSVGSLGTATGYARFAALRGFICALQGSSGAVYVYNGSTLTEITDVDFGSSVKDIASINGRLLGITGDDQFAWSELLDPDNIDALSFATAERSPDDLKAILVNHQEVWLMGGDSIEVYYDAGPPDVFVPLSGGFVERGLLTRDAAVQEDNSIFWVGEDRVVYRADGYRPARISSHYIEDRLGAVAASEIDDIIMWSYSQDGHKFVGLRTKADGTYVYDIATGLWAERDTRGRDAYRVTHCVERDNAVIAADGAANALYTIDPAERKDGTQNIISKATAYIPARRRQHCFSFTVDCTKGRGDNDTPDPQIMLRYSDDQGQTWSAERLRSLGATGEYTASVTWRQLGQIKPPGRIFEISVSDPVKVAVYGARMNDIDP